MHGTPGGATYATPTSVDHPDSSSPRYLEVLRYKSKCSRMVQVGSTALTLSCRQRMIPRWCVFSRASCAGPVLLHAKARQALGDLGAKVHREHQETSKTLCTRSKHCVADYLWPLCACVCTRSRVFLSQASLLRKFRMCCVWSGNTRKHPEHHNTHQARGGGGRPWETGGRKSRKARR